MARRSRSIPLVAPTPPVFTVAHGGVTYPIAVKRVGSARRFTLRVRSATRDAVLTLPPRASLRQARAFAERHAEWIGERLTGLPDRIVLGPGAIVPLRGVDHRVCHDSSALVAVRVRAPDPDGSGPSSLVVGGPASAVGRTLMTFLRREALRDFDASVRKHAPSVGRAFSRITVRDTRSRWGSCSSRGRLSFSWRLILAPPFVLDYLVVHEMAHLVHLDHSAAFWALTRRLAPHTEAAERWLKLNGPVLHLYAAQ